MAGPDDLHTSNFNHSVILYFLPTITISYSKLILNAGSVLAKTWLQAQALYWHEISLIYLLYEGRSKQKSSFRWQKSSLFCLVLFGLFVFFTVHIILYCAIKNRYILHLLLEADLNKYEIPIDLSKEKGIVISLKPVQFFLSMHNHKSTWCIDSQMFSDLFLA